eukprot:UN28076
MIKIFNLLKIILCMKLNLKKYKRTRIFLNLVLLSLSLMT